MLTRPFANGAAVSITGDNLKYGLWKEMAKWMAVDKRNPATPLFQQIFDQTSEQISHKQFGKRWFLGARQFSKTANKEQLGDTLAGLHEKFVFVLIDEAGGVPIAILQAADAIHSSATESHVVIAGNTNTLEGSLYLACVKQAHLWKVIPISGDPDDPDRSTRVDIEWARELIRANGRDDPFVKVMVLGEWPAASLNALIGPDEVEAAMRRNYRDYQYRDFAKVIGVDVALNGLDASVITKRQGPLILPQLVYRNVNSIQGAGIVAREWGDWDADACFVDATGGFGAGWIDQLRHLGRAAIGVQYAGEALQKSRYYNKRTEMYFELVDWIKAGGQLPPHPELTAALTNTLFAFKGDRMMLEPKLAVKAKIGYSPDHADSAAQTFHSPVTPRGFRQQPNRSRMTAEYDPFSKAFEVMEGR
jgi:hypothetical protein